MQDKHFMLEVVVDLMLLMFMMDVREASKLFAGARICRVLQDLKILVVVV